MNWNKIEGNWTQFKGKVQKQWGKLTNDEIDQIEGRREELKGALQKHYGYDEDQANRAINDFLKVS